MENPIPWPGWALVRFQGRGAGGQIYEIRKAGASASMTVVRIPRNPTETRALAEQGLSPEQIRAKYKNDLDILTRKFNQLTALGGTPGLVRCQTLTAEPDGPGWQVFLRTELLTPLPGALTPEQTVRAGKELCRGVAALRQTLRGPLDIRSGNIFLAANGSFRLADFSVVPENGNFAPPEIQPPRVPGPEGDEYALGMVLYRMLNRGCGPFLTADSSDADHAVAEKARLQGVLLPDPAVGQPRLKDLVRKACHPDPAQRYASVGALTASLDFLSGSAAPRSSGPSGRTAPAVPKHRTHRTGKIIVLSVALALLVCLTAGGILWGLSRQTAPAPEATRPPHRPVHTEPTRTSQLLPVITEPAETEAPETIPIETGPMDTEPVDTLEHIAGNVPMDLRLGHKTGLPQHPRHGGISRHRMPGQFVQPQTEIRPGSLAPAPPGIV